MVGTSTSPLTRPRRPLTAALAALLALTLAGSAGGAAPRFVRNIPTGETGWFSSPGLVDLNRDGRKEIVAPFYSTFVYSARGRLLGKGTATSGRVYAPSVVADMDNDGRPEVVVGGNEGTVAAYNLRDGGLRLKPGWPASTCSGGQCPETRGLAAGDLDQDGRIEVVATTTNTSPSGSQVFVFGASGASAAGWPRYNTGADAGFNGAGNSGYGAYGENVGIGNLDNDRQLEAVVTFDNHQINLFNHDGTSVLASPWYTNRQSDWFGRRLGWGQFIRWLSPRVERDHYHRHVGDWPDVRRTPWLQWTASPPSVADLDRDGRNEVIGVPNVEKKEPYETQAYAFMVLDGAQGNGRRSARRHRGFGRLPLTGKPAVRPDGDWYPPSGIPAPTIVEHPRRPPARDRGLGARRPRVRDRPDRQAAVALRLRPRSGEDVRVGGRGRRPQPRRPPRARLRHLRRGPALGPPGGALGPRQAAARHPPPKPGHERQRDRRAGRALDRRPEPRRAPRDRGLDLRPRDRRLPRPALAGQPAALAHRPRQPPAQRAALGRERPPGRIGRGHEGALAAELAGRHLAGGGAAQPPGEHALVGAAVGG